MKIGFFGGSFSPVHIGHISIVREVLRKGIVDKLLLVPCKRNPLKENSPTIDTETRCKLLKKAITYSKKDSQEFANVEVDETELNLPEPSYTIDTLKALHKKYPEDDLVLIMGADSYASLERWRDSDNLKKNYRIVVYPRPGFVVDKENLKSEDIIFLDNIEEYDISSTRIRKMWEEDNFSNLKLVMPWLEE